MSQDYLTLAAVDLSQLRALQRSSPGKTGLDLVLGAIGVVVAALLIWAIFIRKREDATARRYREHFSGSGDSPSTTTEGASNQRSSRRRKKRRREHRQRNPTLAETGGLPPIRDHMPSQEDPP